MPLNSGDILEVGAYGIMDNQQTVNIFHYDTNIVTAGVNYGDILDDFIASVLEPISAVQTINFNWTSIYIQNISDGLEFANAFAGVGGVATGDFLPPFICYGFTLFRSTFATKNGFKRFSGVPEDVIEDGRVNMDTGLRTAIEQALSLPRTIEAGGGELVVTPVIVGRNPDGSYDFSRVNPIQSAQLRLYPTSQNSRKVPTLL